MVPVLRQNSEGVRANTERGLTVAPALVKAKAEWGYFTHNTPLSMRNSWVLQSASGVLRPGY